VETPLRPRSSSALGPAPCGGAKDIHELLIAVPSPGRAPGWREQARFPPARSGGAVRAGSAKVVGESETSRGRARVGGGRVASCSLGRPREAASGEYADLRSVGALETLASWPRQPRMVAASRGGSRDLTQCIARLYAQRVEDDVPGEQSGGTEVLLRHDARNDAVFPVAAGTCRPPRSPFSATYNLHQLRLRPEAVVRWRILFR